MLPNVRLPPTFAIKMFNRKQTFQQLLKMNYWKYFLTPILHRKLNKLIRLPWENIALSFKKNRFMFWSHTVPWWSFFRFMGLGEENVCCKMLFNQSSCKNPRFWCVWKSIFIHFLWVTDNFTSWEISNPIYIWRFFLFCCINGELKLIIIHFINRSTII